MAPPVSAADLRKVNATAASLYRIDDFKKKIIADIIQGQVSKEEAVDGGALLTALLAAKPPSGGCGTTRALSKQLQAGAINEAVKYIKHEHGTRREMLRALAARCNDMGADLPAYDDVVDHCQAQLQVDKVDKFGSESLELDLFLYGACLHLEQVPPPAPSPNARTGCRAAAAAR